MISLSTYLKNEVEKNKKNLSSFIEEFEKCPEKAFEWSDDAMHAAARLTVFNDIIETIKQNKVLTLDDVQQYARSETVRLAMFPRKSTSQSSNLMSIYRAASWAQAVNILDHVDSL